MRFYSVFRGKKRDEWLAKLRGGWFEVEAGKDLAIAPESIQLFADYLDGRDADLRAANDRLRTKAEALAFCEALKFAVGMTSTQFTRLDGYPPGIGGGGHRGCQVGM